MPQKGVLDIGNWPLGQRADGALRDDRMLSARSLINFDILFTDGRLRVRKGFEKFNDTALAGNPTQLYYFRTMSDPDKDHVMCIADDNWYVAKASGAHTLLSAEDATAPRPVLEYGDRLFFGTDDGWHWTDDSAIGGATTNYRVGIEGPTNVAGVALVNTEGNGTSPSLQPNQANIAGAPPPGLVLNSGTHRQLAMSYTPGANQSIRNVTMAFMSIYAVPNSGSIRISIYTGLGAPVAVLSSDAISDWVDITDYVADGVTYNYHSFIFQDSITLTAGTNYWMVIESDSNYLANYNALAFYVAFAYSTGAVLGTSIVYNGAAWGNEPNGYMASFALDGLIPTDIYDYKLTFFNDTYKSESRPNDRSIRVFPTIFNNRVLISTPATLDGQVDFCGIYRRNMGDDPTLSEDEITTDYQYVDRIIAGNVFADDIHDADLGAKLTSDDHYLYDEFDEEGTGVRTEALLPNVATVWKDRIWFAEADSNILYMSKILEENSSMGLIGDAKPDYFPLENQLEMPIPSGVIALKPLSDDMLAVYFRDESIWVIWGANDVKNPPSDIRIDDKTPANGLIATTALDRLEGRHIIMTRDGVYAFHPTGVLQFLSETNQSIFDAIETANLENSVVTVYGNEIWCLIDDDNDELLDTILILDMQRDIQTRQLYDRAWRSYDYGVNLNDIIVRKAGGTFRTLLAASADEEYIYELNTGTLDNGSPIVAEVETHDLRLPDRVMIYRVQVVPGSYENVPPSYELILTDHLGQTQFYELHPSSSDDVRGHRVGCRLVSSPQARAKVIMRTVNEDELLGLAVYYAGRV